MTKAEKTKQPKGKSAKKKIPGSFRLTADAFIILGEYWRVLGGITLVYLLINLFLASGLSTFSTALSGVEDKVNLADEEQGKLTTAFDSFAGLLSGSGTDSGSALQSVMLVIASLVIIWSLRQLLAGKRVGVKQAFYHSMAPFVPFVLIVFVIILQLLPITVGTAALGIILSSVFNNDALVTVIASISFTALAAWSLYMLCSSVFALYIVTLPDMQPRQALRSAKNLVRFKRWQLMRRIVYLPLFILFVMTAAVVPLVLLLPVAAVAVFYLLATAAVLFSHIYLYNLYRSLL